jgi:hypothetical protein
VLHINKVKVNGQISFLIITMLVLSLTVQSVFSSQAAGVQSNYDHPLTMLPSNVTYAQATKNLTVESKLFGYLLTILQA